MFFFVMIYFMGMSLLPTCIYVPYVYTWCLWKPEENGPLEQMVVSHHVGVKKQSSGPLYNSNLKCYATSSVPIIFPVSSLFPFRKSVND